MKKDPVLLLRDFAGKRFNTYAILIQRDGKTHVHYRGKTNELIAMIELAKHKMAADSWKNEEVSENDN